MSYFEEGKNDMTTTTTDRPAGPGTLEALREAACALYDQRSGPPSTEVRVDMGELIALETLADAVFACFPDLAAE